MPSPETNPPGIRTPEVAEVVIDTIEIIRNKNNVAWMTILRIAMEVAPDRTREVLRQINANDLEIGKWLSRLAD